MVFLKKRFTRSNYLVLLLMGNTRKFASWGNLYMGWNYLLEHVWEICLHCSGVGLLHSIKDHYVCFQYHQGKWILLVVYVDDIVITGNDTLRISKLKLYLQKKFQTKDIRPLIYTYWVLKWEDSEKEYPFYSESMYWTWFMKQAC